MGSGISRIDTVIFTNEEGARHIQKLEFDWVPKRCKKCLVFGHSSDQCSPSTSPTTQLKPPPSRPGPTTEWRRVSRGAKGGNAGAKGCLAEGIMGSGSAKPLYAQPKSSSNPFHVLGTDDAADGAVGKGDTSENVRVGEKGVARRIGKEPAQLAVSSRPVKLCLPSEPRTTRSSTQRAPNVGPAVSWEGAGRSGAQGTQQQNQGCVRLFQGNSSQVEVSAATVHEAKSSIDSKRTAVRGFDASKALMGITNEQDDCDTDLELNRWMEEHRDEDEDLENVLEDEVMDKKEVSGRQGYSTRSSTKKKTQTKVGDKYRIGMKGS